MSPLVAQRLASARQNFHGKIYVVKDFDYAALVLIVPAEREGEDGEDGDWGRVTKPTLMIINPALSGDDGPPQ